MDDLFKKNVALMRKRLEARCVAIAGCGGCGSNAAVALTRAGIGKLLLADFDRVEMSNLNRQHYFESDIGKKKVGALTAHLMRINPGISIEALNVKVSEENIKSLLGSADVLIEAFDMAENKKWLIESWSRAYPEKPVICCSGLAGMGKTNELKVEKAGNIYICGDQKSDIKQGLCSARVAIVAAMQANVTIEILMNDHPGKKVAR